MYALTSLVCSMMLAASPVIEDAPSHRLTAYAPSVIPEDVGAPLIPLALEEIEAPQVVENPSPLSLKAQEIQVMAPLDAVSAPKAEISIDLKPSKLSLEAPIEIPSTSSSSIADASTKEAAPMPVVELSVQKEAHINLAEVFSGAPLIYSLLLLMSLSALAIWVYHLLLMRKEEFMPAQFSDIVEGRLAAGNWQEALVLCRKENNLLAILIRATIAARHEGSQAMIDRMQAEGKRATSFFWQRLSLLNDIALIAPMIGLLGTVLGMFYAFYDVNRSLESMYTLFDGLGISVGTTVAGLIVAIMALIFHSTLKYRLVRQLALVETKAQKIALHPTPRQHNVQLRESHESST